MLCLLNLEKMWAGSSQGLLCRVYVMKCRSQLVVSAIFTPGALELWGCRWPNAGVISSVSLIIYTELITRVGNFCWLKTAGAQRKTCIWKLRLLKGREKMVLPGLSSRHAPGKAMSFIATAGFWELTSNLEWWLTIATVAKVTLLDSYRILFFNMHFTEK